MKTGNLNSMIISTFVETTTTVRLEMGTMFLLIVFLAKLKFKSFRATLASFSD